jgi:hypothetical protein
MDKWKYYIFTVFTRCMAERPPRAVALFLYQALQDPY